MKEPTLFDTEQQTHKDKVLAAAGEYLTGRSGCKRRRVRTKRRCQFMFLKKKFLEKCQKKVDNEKDLW